MDQLLDKWFKLKQEIQKLSKEEEAIKARIKSGMKTKKLDAFRTTHYRVVIKEMSRESLSKKECPPEVWKKYAKKNTYDMIKLDLLGEETSEEPETE